jgi:hypothetical protein
MLAGGEIDPEWLITRTLRGLEALADVLRHPQSLADDLKVICELS